MHGFTSRCRGTVGISGQLTSGTRYESKNDCRKLLSNGPQLRMRFPYSHNDPLVAERNCGSSKLGSNN
eukprot:5820409-Amphidinium_carterae.1